MKERLLTDVEPRDVFMYFEDLTFIPRDSRKEKEVSDYLMEFAKKHNLEAYQDEYFNVLIKKGASPGYEDHPGVILQAHMDMVCEKNPDFEFDFDSDPIEFEVDGDLVVARDTTLGADDGIGMAMAMAILADDDIKHPPLEFLCTTDEESGMLGIENFNFDLIKGDRLINLDNSDEGVIVAACAGGPDVRIDIPINKIQANPNKKYYEVRMQGLLGGHSGEDIHRGRANANKQLVRFLNKISMDMNYVLANFEGGLKSNAIPRNAFAIIGIDNDSIEMFESKAREFAKTIKDEYRVNDPDSEFVYKETDIPVEVLDETSASNVCAFISFCETGILRRNQDYPQFVESSVSLGVVRVCEDNAYMLLTERSSLDSMHEYISETLISLAKYVGGTYTVLSYSPVWTFKPESEMVDLYSKIYEEMYGKKTETTIFHAGVESGMFSLRIERELDMIALGPNCENLHSPGEYVSISSTKRVYDSIKALIEAL